MNTKHTTGPWEFVAAGFGGKDGKLVVDEIFVRNIGDDVAIAERIIDPHTCKPSISNARLIAAAPELLEALARCLENSLMRRESGVETGPMIDREIEQARAAIAKAIGA